MAEAQRQPHVPVGSLMISAAMTLTAISKVSVGFRGRGAPAR